ncbi:hypothetical protein Tco_1270726 [Tanacetum coccineum]
MEKLENENVSLGFQVQSLIKERENIKLEYQKLFDSIKKTCTQTQGEIDELIENLKNIEKGLKDATSVRRPSSRGSSSKNGILLNTDNHSEDVEVSARTNKKTNVASKKNVVQNKKIVTNINVKNDLKAKDVLFVSCDKNVFTPCHDKCLAKFNLNVNSNVRRALFTTPRTAKSKSLDNTHVVTKTRLAVVSPLSAKTKDLTASRSTSIFSQELSLSKYMRNKIKISRKWQKWYEKQLNVGWTPKQLTTNEKPCVVINRDYVVSNSNTSVTIRKWVAKPCTLPSVVFSCNAGVPNSSVDY